METQRLGKIWARVQMIVLVPMGLGAVVLSLIDVFSPTAAAQPGMPWGQFAAILVPLLLIFAVSFYLQYKRSPQLLPAEPPKLPGMSDDMRGLAKYGIVFALFGLCIFLPGMAIKLGNGVGTREWFRSLCVLVMVAMCIPTQVQWAIALWKKKPETAA